MRMPVVQMHVPKGTCLSSSLPCSSTSTLFSSTAFICAHMVHPSAWVIHSLTFNIIIL